MNKVFKKLKLEIPILVWDGSCKFCALCATRFEYAAAGKVLLVPYQKLNRLYPKAPKLDYNKSIFFFSTNGEVFSGAGAFFRFYNEIGKSLGYFLYKKFNMFKRFTEFLYNIVAKNRRYFSKITKLLWGDNILKDSFSYSSYLYGKSLGIVALVAFFSLGSQINELIGSKGIIPLEQELIHVQNVIGNNNDAGISKYQLRPTLFWVFKSDLALNTYLVLGVVASIFIILGFLQPVALFFLWILYLSFVVITEPFFNFQWDSLLLESLFISMFFVPWTLRNSSKYIIEPLAVFRWLIWLLLFKVLFESGIVKFTYFSSNGSNAWLDMTALDYHYWTQPLPHELSWYLSKMPNFFHQLSLVFIYFSELIVPFGIFFPRKIRRLACFFIIIFQLLIMLTGNYGFFNILIISLAVTLIDDQWFKKGLNKTKLLKKNITEAIFTANIKKILSVPILIIFILTSYLYLVNDIKGNRIESSTNISIPTIENSLIDYMQRYRLFNAYGLFRVMTKDRPEILIETMDKDSIWSVLNFKHKPSLPSSELSFTIPHMHRIDWQLWFEARYIKELMKDPLALSTYVRFLDVMVNKKINMSDAKMASFVTSSELKMLESLEIGKREAYIKKLRINLNNFLNQSYWFAKFLLALSEDRIESLKINNQYLEKGISQIRISLKMISFNKKNILKDKWAFEPINQVSFILKLN